MVEVLVCHGYTSYECYDMAEEADAWGGGVGNDSTMGDDVHEHAVAVPTCRALIVSVEGDITLYPWYLQNTDIGRCSYGRGMGKDHYGIMWRRIQVM